MEPTQAVNPTAAVINEQALPTRFVPNQVDFALLTINETEDQGVREVFEFFKERGIFSPSRQMVGHRGIYTWGHVKTASRDELVIVHASTGDRKGPLPAIELIRELDQLFRPQYLLVLGTAGGIGERRFGYGQVVFSRQVHVGYQNLVDLGDDGDQGVVGTTSGVQITLHDDPVQPPLDRLHSHAQRVANSWQILGRALYDNPDSQLRKLRFEAIQAVGLVGAEKETSSTWKADLLRGLDQIQHPRSTEIYSGPYLVDGRKSDLYRSILATFPKVGAIEMEAGAVGQAVLYSVETERYIGYLVIKGLSDVVDSEVPRKHRKDVRKALGPLASCASARFARDLIEGWEGDPAHSAGRIPLVPPKYSAALGRELDSKRFSNSEIYVQLSIDQYSRLIEALCASTEIRSLWTLCYLAPYRFLAELEADNKDVNTDHERSVSICRRYREEGRSKDLIEALKSKFPHFQLFLDLTKRRAKVTRIMHAGLEWRPKNEHCSEVFGALNGEGEHKISCFVLEKADFDGEDRWARSDQVVINDELLLDYDMTSQRLIVTYLDRDGLRPAFIRFRDHCETKSKEKNEYEKYFGYRRVN